MLTFLFPAILGVAVAVAAPIIIHLILRTKPRRVVFPAMRFVRKTHQANLSKLRLKHLILLAMRMAAIVLIAGLIARAQIPNWRSAQGNEAPSAAVFVIDNSGSMGYLHHGVSRLAAGKKLARQVAQSLPEGSRMAMLTTADPLGGSGFFADRRFSLQQISDVPLTAGHQSLAATVSRAVEMLDSIRMARKEIYIVTDQTAQAWRDGTGALAAGGVDFIVLNCGGGENVNVALGAVHLSASAVPQGAEVTVEGELRSAQAAGEMPVRLELQGKPVDQTIASAPSGAAAAFAMSFLAQQEGLLQGRLVLQHDDGLELDNVRYFTVMVGPPAEMLVVSDRVARRTDEAAAVIVGKAIDPFGDARTTGVRRRDITADRLDAAALSAAGGAAVVDVSSLRDGQWEMLEDYARTGHQVWIVVGPLMSPASYNSPAAQRIMPVTFKSLEELSKEVAWSEPEAKDPLLEPFTRDGAPPLSEVLCYKRMAVASVAPDSRVVLKFSDGAVAMASRPVGDGSVLLWNFSPVREFSNLAQLAQFPILVQRALRLMNAAGLAVQTSYLFGSTVTIPIPQAMRASAVTVGKPDSAVEEPVLPAAGNKAITLTADRLGFWRVQFLQGPKPMVLGFSVNADPAESDLTPMDERKLKAQFPQDHFWIVSDEKEIQRRRHEASQALDLTGPLLLALLGLLVGESFFANRFYRQRQGAADQSSGK